MNEIKTLISARDNGIVRADGFVSRFQVLKDLEQKGFLKQNPGYYFANYWTITDSGEHYLKERGYFYDK